MSDCFLRGGGGWEAWERIDVGKVRLLGQIVVADDLTCKMYAR